MALLQQRQQQADTADFWDLHLRRGTMTERLLLLQSGAPVSASGTFEAEPWPRLWKKALC
jgi:hypothetical protein